MPLELLLDKLAPERGQLFLEYQPQIDLASGALVGVESLLRWRHPQQGVIGPVRFIPLAESRGMMGEIGLWGLSESCRQWIAWRDEGLAIERIAVNVSAVQIKGGRGFEQILAIVESSGMPPGTLEIEFTESAFVDMSADILRGSRGCARGRWGRPLASSSTPDSRGCARGRWVSPSTTSPPAIRRS